MGNQASVKSHIENAQRTGVFQLSNSKLDEFPKDIQKIKNNVRSLDLSQNKIKIIPEFIGTFVNLKHFNLNSNKIHFIPEEMGHLRKLETLSMNSNLLSSLPSSLEDLVNLRTLVLSDNQLRVFPKQISRLKHLDVVDLSKNKIQIIPDGLEELNVSELNLNQNQVSKVSESLASCPRLKVLRLDENCLQLDSIPSKILKDSSISLLTLEGNMFEMKEFNHVEGYDQYLERYTATKKKLS